MLSGASGNSILAHKVIGRGNVTSVEDLWEKITRFSDVFDKIAAKPFRWIDTGKPLTARADAGLGIFTAVHRRLACIANAG